MILGNTLILCLVAAIFGTFIKYVCDVVLKWPWWVGNILMLTGFGFVLLTGPIVIGK